MFICRYFLNNRSKDFHKAKDKLLDLSFCKKKKKIYFAFLVTN